MSFFGQFHYGVFYAYLKLKEMEIANVVQLAELHSIGSVPKNDPTWNCFVAPFQYDVDLNADQ
jgi:V-type H+-transporting ATPase subunit d